MKYFFKFIKYRSFPKLSIKKSLYYNMKIRFLYSSNIINLEFLLYLFFRISLQDKTGIVESENEKNLFWNDFIKKLLLLVSLDHPNLPVVNLTIW